LKAKILNPRVPVVFFEMAPPVAGKPEALKSAMDEIGKIHEFVDAINLPEIHDESRGADRTFKFVPRVEPREMGGMIVREFKTGVVVNRCVVYEANQGRWFQETTEKFGINNLVLVGGESSKAQYPGPSVLEAAREIRATGRPATLGGISIPSRAHEVERIRRKAEEGLCFFTTQVLFDPNDIVWLIQRLNGLEARIFLSFAPVSNNRDIEFLRWLGVDVPADLDQFLLENAREEESSAQRAERAFQKCFDLAKRVLMDVFDNLPPDPPPLGLNIEHINRRNFRPAVQMLEQLGTFYASLVTAHSDTRLV